MKAKKSILNFITEVAPLIAITILGLYKSKLLISNLATDSVGLYQLFSQLLGYVTIFELGMTGALLYRFFEPIAKKDQEKINILFYSGRKIFFVVAIIMMVISIIISLFMPLLIKDNPFDLGYLTTTFVMYVSTNIIYYLIVSYKLLLDAQQKKYITNIIIESFNIIKSILEILVLVFFKDLLLLLSVGIVTTVMASLIIVIVCKKQNPNLKKTDKRDYSMISDIKNLFVHKIAYIVNNNIDLLIITKFFGLAYVVVYSTYNFLINSLKKVTSRMYVSLVPSLGNTLVESKENAKKIFYEINNFMFYVAIVICSTVLVLINPFIQIWYDGNVNTTFLNSLGFTLVLFCSIAIQPLLAYTDAGGCFKETRKCAVLEAVINLILSFILLKPLGIFGILIATFIGYTIADNIVRSKVILNKLLDEPVKKYYKDLVFFYTIAIIFFVVEYFIFKFVTVTNIIMWFVIVAIVFLLNSTILFVIFSCTNRINFLKRLNFLKILKVKGDKNEKN